MGFAQERFKFDRPPKLFFKQDQENAKNVLGKTAFYDPQQQSITLFTTNRHPKDILRSLAHELVHHTQNLRGDFNSSSSANFGPGYAQENPDLRELEREAYEQGNLCFRDWEDGYKKQLQEVKFLKESKKMTKKVTKKTLEGLIRRVLSEQMTSRERAAMIARKNREMGLTGVGDPAQDGPNPVGMVRQDDEETLGNVFRNAPAAGTPRVNRQQQDAMDRTRGDKELSNVPTTYMGGRTGADEDDDIALTRRAQAAMAGDPVVNRKSRQQSKFLRRAGFRNMKQLQRRVGAQTTGIYDAQTMNAIKAFQKRLGFDLDGQDGVYGPATARRLAARQDVRVNQGDISDISSPVVPKSKPLQLTPKQKDQSLADIVGLKGPDAKLIGRKDRSAEIGDPLDGYDPSVESFESFAASHGLSAADQEIMRDADAALDREQARQRKIPMRESIDPLGEGSGCGSPGKRDVEKKVVLDEKSDIGMGVHPKDKKKLGKNAKPKRCSIIKGKTDHWCFPARSLEEYNELMKEQLQQERTRRTVDYNSDSPGNTKLHKRMAAMGYKVTPTPKATKGQDQNEDGKKAKCEKCKNCKCPGGGQACDKCKRCEKCNPVAEGSKIYTPEQEQALYESRFNNRNEQIFDKLKKLWTK